ncbi:GDSL-type esterase/lipase family protein [Seonamhaeicola marinus]|uniref:Polysaccharide deacetylase family protein n=1 Tax=Seonamhaeicola marinus TaxID=1912246 RepID=A0A5D0HRP7_9FLAO|nr:GDSL-type esterase/lipase family protein [Seonamhaeicola marinus]TYA74043.1 polysaccharide deacetylase family protein [Seonamhaeicola marinus]
MNEIGKMKLGYLFIKLSSLLSILFMVSCNTSVKDSKNNLNALAVEPQIPKTNTTINTQNFSFPNGKLKCLVISFDDGPEHDRILLEKLNKANIIGTFHFNSGRLGKRAEWLSSELGYDVHFVTETEIGTIYKGHEVSSHGVNHSGLNDQNDSVIRDEIGLDIDKLNALIAGTHHVPVKGLSYPFGAYDNQTLKTLKALGVEYARTTTSTKNFELPASNFLALNPTCHIFDAANYGSYFVYDEPKDMQLLNIWGHSYEFHNNWKLADSLCNLLGNKKEIWYAKTIELVDYLNAIKALSYTDDSVFNPSKDIAVWIKNNKGDFVELPPEQSMPVSFQSSFREIKTIDSLYPNSSTNIKYHVDWTRVNYNHRIATFKKSPLNFGDIVFVGNSITEQGGNWGEKLGVKNARNRGIAGDVTDGVLKRIDEITYYKPKAVFLLIGINDLFNLHYLKEIPSPEYVANNIIKITEVIHESSPETQIYLQTILPTSADYMAENINKVNALIKAREKDANYQLINLFEAFVGDNGLIKPHLTSDGTHLNELGYKLWVETIKSEVDLN